jgi:hypothetical protein
MQARGEITSEIVADAVPLAADGFRATWGATPYEDQFLGKTLPWCVASKRQAPSSWPS